MQAVVVAGGLGTRLRPLTLTRPKALIPLVNKPQIVHTLERLPTAVDEVFVAVNYMFEAVRSFLASFDAGRTVVPVEEPTPLGTGGAVANVAARIRGRFLVYNGDIVDGLDGAALLQRHADDGAIATVALHEVDDPSPFGVAGLEGDRIVRFVEKPHAADAPSRWVNAGRYVFEPTVLDFIPRGREVSLEREVFPALVPKGLRAFRFADYWCDAGTLEGYLRASATLLAVQGKRIAPDADLRSAEVEPPVDVASGTRARGRIGPNAVLGPGCRVRGADVRESALFARVVVESGATIEQSVLGDDVTVGRGAFLRNAVVGDGVVVPDAARLDGVRLP